MANPWLTPNVNSIVHDEDLDLSGGAAAIAAALAAGNLGHTLSGTDQAVLPSRETRLMAILAADESAADADGSVTIGLKRKIELPFEATGPGYVTRLLYPGGMRLRPKETIDVVGRSTGAGAEHHTVVCLVDDPGLGPPFALKSPRGAKAYLAVAQPTGTLVAHTLSGFTDVCGRSAAYTGSQNKIPDSAKIQGVLHAITPLTSAGYNAVVIRSAGGQRQLVLPARGPPTGNCIRYDLVEMLGGGLAFSADAPLELGGIGVGTTAQGALLEMALFGDVGADG